MQLLAMPTELLRGCRHVAAMPGQRNDELGAQRVVLDARRRSWWRGDRLDRIGGFELRRKVSELDRSVARSRDCRRQCTLELADVARPAVLEDRVCRG